MCKVACCLCLSASLVASAYAQPKSWSDDFKTAATYNSDSVLAPCYTVGAPSTKYTVFEGATGDIFNQRAVSGGGRLTFTNMTHGGGLAGFGRIDMVVPGAFNIGQGCPDVSGLPSMTSTEWFTSPRICIYGGIVRNPWQLRYPGPNNWKIKGADGQPGIANVDDDIDGTTDEDNETVARRPTTVNGGFGNANGTGFRAGRDGAPGVAGVDDDANGTIDNIGETGWLGTDDGDDTCRNIWWVVLNSNADQTELLYLCMDNGSTKDGFSLRELVGASGTPVEWEDEIAFGFFSPYVRYNWVLCSNGTCYGAMLWTGADMANPDETLGPVANSLHNGSGDNLLGLAHAWHFTAQYLRKMAFTGNSNFSDTFWIVSGNPAQYYPSPSADLDDDKDVDGFDFLTFSNCYNGSNKPPLGACANTQADLDKDGDVDGFDFLTFSNCYNGSNKKPLVACFPPDLTTCGS